MADLVSTIERRLRKAGLNSMSAALDAHYDAPPTTIVLDVHHAVQ
jgi:hypothetical protein